MVEHQTELKGRNQIDFGLLDEAFQKRIIARVATDRSAVLDLIRINPFLADPGYISNPDRLIETNLRAVSTGYNTAAYRLMLKQIYERVVKTKVTHCLNSTPLLDYFLEPSHFSLLKWCDYVGK